MRPNILKSEIRVLIIDDEQDILEILSYNLQNEGYKVFTACDGCEGIKNAKRHQPHLIIIDVMMPGIDGVEACEQIRSIDILKNTKIAFYTARTEDYSQIAGFNAGADDYISKPTSIKVILSRVKALLKRHDFNISGLESISSNNKIVVNDIEINRERLTVIQEGKEIHLPKKEFNLLLLLSSNPGKVYTRSEIFSQVWGDDVYVTNRSIDVHIRKLRTKIGVKSIITVKGVGYKLSVQN